MLYLLRSNIAGNPFECPICGHEFHDSCLLLALTNEQRCPHCMKNFQINELRLIYQPYNYENVRNIEELEEKIETLENENSIMTIMLIQFDKDKSSLENQIKSEFQSNFQ